MRESNRLQRLEISVLRKYLPEILTTIVVLLYYLTTPVLFNYTDGIVFATSHIDALYPHYPLLYPLLTQTLVFLTESFCDTVKGMQLLQLFLVWLSLLYTINSFSVRKKWQVTITLLLFTPIIVFQLGPGTESLFISGQLFFLSSFLRILQNRARWDVVVHLSALLLMLSARHTGIIIASFPFIFLGLKWLKDKTKKNFLPILKLGGAYGVIYLCLTVVNTGATFALGSTKVPLYGRPAMHIISVILENIDNKEEYDRLISAWRSQANDEFDLKLQECIVEAGNIWMGPRMCLEEYVNHKYPYFLRQKKRTFIDQHLNDVYIQFLATGDKHIYQYFVGAFMHFLPGYSDAVNSYIDSHNNFFKDNPANSVWRCETDRNENKLFFVRLAGVVEQLFTGIGFCMMIWMWIFRYRLLRNKLLCFSLALMLFLHVIVLTLFTCYLSRYTIPNTIILIFIGLLLLPEQLYFRQFFKKIR